MHRVALIILALAVAGCAGEPPAVTDQPGPAFAVPAGVTYDGGNGLECDKAVVIKGAKYYREGVDAEYAWLADKYPGYTRNAQKTARNGSRNYDQLSITTADRRNVQVCFDVTEFAGK